MHRSSRRPKVTRTTCAVGIAFYRSRDYTITNTSLAQIFDELGTGIILRGTPVELEKDEELTAVNHAEIPEWGQEVLKAWVDVVSTASSEQEGLERNLVRCVPSATGIESA